MRKLLLAGVSSVLILSQTGCAATDKVPLDSPSIVQTHMLKSGTTLNDVLSTRAVGESCFEGKETAAVILLGNRLVFELQDGKTAEVCYSEPNKHQPVLTNQDLLTGFGTGMWILTYMFTDFKKRKEIVGQANLSLIVKEDHTCEILSKSLYVPGCQPYTGGAEIPPGVQEFWEQIKSAVAAVETRYLKVPGPQVKSETLEIVIGRDPSKFPRYATPFNGMLVRDGNGKVQHVKAFVRDGAD